MQSRSGLTYADLETFDDDGLRRELIDGELIVSPSPKLRHQDIVLRIATAFFNHIADHSGGRVFVAPLDVVLSDDTVLEPDVLFVADDRIGTLTEPNIQGAPSLVVEVLSNPRVDRVRKRDAYARFGVPEYWIAGPDADRIEVFRLVETGYGKPEIYEPGETLEPGCLPGFRLDLAKTFAR